jgi:hypothetical protein
VSTRVSDFKSYMKQMKLVHLVEQFGTVKRHHLRVTTSLAVVKQRPVVMFVGHNLRQDAQM